MLRTLEAILASKEISLAYYVGHAHLEVADLLHKWIPGRYALMDKGGRHRDLFHWRIVGECEDFALRDFQPPRPDSLKVPFWEEGGPPTDFLIFDTPLYPDQLPRIVASNHPRRRPPAFILLADEAIPADLPDNYHWEICNDHIVGRHQSPVHPTSEELENFDAQVAGIQRHFAPSLDEHLKREGLQVYSYIGNPSLIRNNPDRHEISGKNILARVHQIHLHDQDGEGFVPCTYIMDRHKSLWVAERRSEHVACAHGEPVLAAGELFIEKESKHARIARISNLSTGYCPRPESWEIVHSQLIYLGIDHPPSFDPCCEFRRCESCANLQLVKNDDWTCSACGADLPSEWNIATTHTNI